MDTSLGQKQEKQMSQIYLYSTFHNTDCIKAASQYQSRQFNSVCLFMEKKDNQVRGRADQ